MGSSTKVWMMRARSRSQTASHLPTSNNWGAVQFRENTLCFASFPAMCENMDNTHARRFDDTVRRRAGERGAIMTLRDCPRAMRVVVDGIDLMTGTGSALCEIGLAPGAGLRVMQRSAFGGRVVAFGNERVAVDGGTARAVRVRFARDEHAQDDVA